MGSHSTMSNDMTTIIYENEIDESSDDSPMRSWPSFEVTLDMLNAKKMLYKEGLYSPGSGDVCTKYIAQSDSEIAKHVYYRYPPISDPGIVNALLTPDIPIIYPDDGQLLYLATCEEMKQYPVKMFYKGLLNNQIDLSYYCVNPNGVRAMALALVRNSNVERLNLTDNFLNCDACYHLGTMLVNNNTLQELNLSGCRIGAEGFQMFLTRMFSNKTLGKIDLSRNELGDVGMRHLAEAIFAGLNISKINLSYNNISGRGIVLLKEGFETHNKVTSWDLSWNKLFTPGTYDFLSSLAESATNLMELDLSWNNLAGLRVAQGIKKLFSVKTLKYLNLSNNKLEDVALKTFMIDLKKATGLVTLNLSYNPMTPNDVFFILRRLKLRETMVRNVLMENVSIDVFCLNLLQEIKLMKPGVVVTFGYVQGTFKPVGTDIRGLILNRANYLCSKQKRNKFDFALLMMQIQKSSSIMLASDFNNTITLVYKVPLDLEIVDGLITIFPGPRDPKDGATINIDAIVEYIHRLWPDKALPVTPPITPKIEPSPEKEEVKGKKGKK